MKKPWWAKKFEFKERIVDDKGKSHWNPTLEFSLNKLGIVWFFIVALFYHVKREYQIMKNFRIKIKNKV
jgi:hypothetical protein